MSRQRYQRTTLGMLAAGVLLAVATSPFWTILVVKHQAARIVNDSLPGLRNSSFANLNISDGFVELALAIAAPDAAARERSLAQIEAISKSTDEQLKSYVQSIDTATEQQRYLELTARRTEYRATRARVIALLGQGKDAEALALYRTAGIRQFVDYKNAIDQVVQFNADEARERGAAIMRLCNYLLILQAVLLVFFFVYAFFVPLVTIFEQVTTRGDLVRDV